MTTKGSARGSLCSGSSSVSQLWRWLHKSACGKMTETIHTYFANVNFLVSILSENYV